ncbi:RNA polymerase sigma factor [Tundrisphaera lichenicola]|uniref:RNA polymerase sigma factor n=1 Tax=Tundrisphaera lichenicola TaxID=2029860 RepID=UPI003EC140AC
MIQRPWPMILGNLHRLFQGGSVAGLSEGQLLDRFVETRDEIAFGAIVERHGPMVLGVCRGVLADPNDVEDAFQATFLVLVRKASRLRDRDLLGPWLYGVARKVALRARADAVRRRVHERSGADSRPQAVATFDAELRELQSQVREEVHRLPANDRMAVVLCYLDGLTHEEAAERLGWPVGTVKGRLSRARDRLKVRLVRRGITLPAVASTLTRGTLAAVPVRLVTSTTRAAAQLAAGQALKVGIVSAQAIALMEGVIGTMFTTNLKIGGAVLLVSCTLAVPGVIAYQGAGPSEAPTPKQAPVVTRPAESSPIEANRSAATPKVGSLRDAQEVQAEFARQAIKLLDQRIAQGQASPTDPSYLTWSRRLAEAISAPGIDEPDRRATLEAHLKRMELNQERAKVALKEGKISQLDSIEASYLLNEAYLWTLNGTALPQGPAPSIEPGFEGGASSPRKPLAIKTLPADEPKNKAILEKLEERISMNFPQEIPLEDVKKYIEQSTQDEAAGLPIGIPIYIDPHGLADSDHTMASTVTINLEGIPLRTTLRLILRQLHLDYKVVGGLLYITDEDYLDNDLPATAPE